MNYTIKTYPGKYKISGDGTKYITSEFNIHESECRIIEINGNSDVEAIFEEILNLDTSNIDNILSYVSKYGLLTNTNYNPNSDSTIYLGDSMSPAFYYYLVDDPEIISMPLFLFIHMIELFKNLFRFSTELSVCENNPELYLNSYEHLYALLSSLSFILFQPYANHLLTREHVFEEEYNFRHLGDSPFVHFSGLVNRLLWGNVNKNNCNDIFLFLLWDLHYIEKMNREIQDASNFSPKNLNEDYTFKFKGHSEHAYTEHGINTIFNPIGNFYAKDTIDPHFQVIQSLLGILSNHCTYSFNNDSTFNIEMNSEKNIKINKNELDDLILAGKHIITENINSYLQNVNPNLYVSDNKQYRIELSSKAFIQNVFYLFANYINEYSVSICKYPGCNKLVFYKNTRVKQCCCRQHTDNYCKLKKRNSPKLYQ